MVPASMLLETSFCDIIMAFEILTSSFTFTLSAMTERPSILTQLPSLQSQDMMLLEM